MSRSILLTFLFLFFCVQLFSQLTPARPAPAGSRQDTTTKLVHIINTDHLRYEKKDSLTDVQILVGHDTLQQGNTFFYCDSAIYTITNKSKKTIEAFGNVHIKDGDSVHTYSQYLLYNVDTKIGTLKKDVRLTNGKSTLYTDEMQYDANLKMGEYHTGGKLINGKSVLTSQEGVYYTELKDAYFKKNVVLKDPKYNLTADSLLYNTGTEVTTFIGPTTIIDSVGRKIQTKEGFYDLRNRVARFGKRPVITDGAVRVIADNVLTNDSTGINDLRGNAVYVDTAQGVSVLANHIVANRKDNTFEATIHPLMIIKQDKDSIYVTADTLYSGKLSTLRKKDSAYAKTDTSSIRSDSSGKIAKADRADSLKIPVDSLQGIAKAEKTAGKNDSADRYFMGWHHVRIFSDSLQAVADSLFYSAEDSVFRLFTDPIAWANNSQVTGDTMYLYTKNKKPEHMRVFENAMAINKSGRDMYNQIKGNRLFGYFNEGEIDHILARGNAESIYYVLDEDSAVTGVNKASSDRIDMRFKNKELSRVVFISAVDGVMLPLSQATEQDKYLRGFKWRDELRPKTKFELFEEPPIKKPTEKPSERPTEKRPISESTALIITSHP